MRHVSRVSGVAEVSSNSQGSIKSPIAIASTPASRSEPRPDERIALASLEHRDVEDHQRDDGVASSLAKEKVEDGRTLPVADDGLESRRNQRIGRYYIDPVAGRERQLHVRAMISHESCAAFASVATARR